MATAGLYEMANGIERALIVVDNHAATVNPRADTVVEHQGNTAVDELFEVVVVHRVLSLTDNDAANLVLVEFVAEKCLSVVLLSALSYHDGISSRHSLLLDAAKDRGEVEMLKLRYDDPNDFHGFCTTVAQILCNHVGDIVMFARILLDTLALFIADTGTVFHRPRYSGHRDAKSLGNVFHGDRCWLFHCQI